MNIISDRNVPQAYCEAFWKMRVWAQEAESRNGPVMRTKDVFLELLKPKERVLFDRDRCANPFFHLMESIWMLAGHQDIRWLKQFNKGIEKYAETEGDEKGSIHGAYGYRWREHFGVDQVKEIFGLLVMEPTTRRAVLGMWDPEVDCHTSFNDLPCNTHIYVTREPEGLEFTVCNRSNDLVWGMLGANCVHLTILQQVLAEALGTKMASYKVFTKDLHVYTNLPRFKEIWNTVCAFDPYSSKRVEPVPILNGMSLGKFLDECEEFILGHRVTNHWLLRTAAPMRDAYLERINGGTGLKNVSSVEATDWRMAAQLYIEQKEFAVSTAEEV